MKRLLIIGFCWLCISNSSVAQSISASDIPIKFQSYGRGIYNFMDEKFVPSSPPLIFQTEAELLQTTKFSPNRRAVYSSLWAFATLNYLYADLIGVMDADMLTQYLTGTVNGMEMTPGFLTGAAAFMQIPMANVFLPQVIKNDRTLRWIQIVSGSIMTTVQAATLFVDKPAPYYVLFSGIELATTAYITVDAIRWKPN